MPSMYADRISNVVGGLLRPNRMPSFIVPILQSISSTIALMYKHSPMKNENAVVNTIW